MSKQELTDGKTSLMEIIKHQEREKVSINFPFSISIDQSINCSLVRVREEEN